MASEDLQAFALEVAKSAVLLLPVSLIGDLIGIAVKRLGASVIRGHVDQYEIAQAAADAEARVKFGESP